LSSAAPPRPSDPAGWKRTYWVVWLANLVTSIGMMSFLVFFPAHLEELGVEGDAVAVWSGLVFGGAPLVASIMTPIWSALGDRFGRRLMTVRAMLAITVFVGAMAWATAPWQLFVLRLCQGFFSGFVAPSITLVSVAAPVHRQGFVAGSLQTALALGSIVGPLIGGAVQPVHGLETVFLGVSAASLVSALLVWFLARENAGDRQRVERGVAPLEVLRGSLKDLLEVWGNPRMKEALQLLFWLLLAVGASNPLMELFVRELGVEPGRTEAVTGLVTSAFAATSLVAMPAWGAYGDRVGHATAMRRCALLGVVALALNAVVSGVVMLFAVRIALAAAMAGASPLPYGLAAAEIPVERRGGAMGAVFSARTLAVASSAMVGGALSQVVGIRGLFALGAVLLLLVHLRTGPAPGAGRRATG
jgi:DHA1 family multidrug resistance protein-like MFS transporter